MPHGKIAIGAPGYFSCSQLGNLYGCGYGTMMDPFLRYKGAPEEKEFTPEQIESMNMGSFFEDTIAKYYAQKMGWKIKKCGETAYWSAKRPWLICHPDRLVVGRPGGKRIALEVKFVNPFAEGWGEEGSTEIPDNYYLQVEGYFVCEVPCDEVHVLCMRGNRITPYIILPDAEVIEDIGTRVDNAKDQFDQGIVPESENYEEALRYFKTKVNDEADGKPAGDEGRAIWDELVANHNIMKDAEDREDELKAKMVTFMGECPSVITYDGKKIKCLAKHSTTTKTSFDLEALQKDHPDIYRKYTSEKVSHSVRFAFPRRKKEQNNG